LDYCFVAGKKPLQITLAWHQAQSIRSRTLA
jgi:hypothetical protein